MVAAVDDNGTPPQELVLAWRCEKWNTLPKAGGYFDQPYELMNRLNLVINVYSHLSTFRSRKGKAIHGMSDAERKMIGFLRRNKFI